MKRCLVGALWIVMAQPAAAFDKLTGVADDSVLCEEPPSVAIPTSADQLTIEVEPIVFDEAPMDGDQLVFHDAKEPPAYTVQVVRPLEDRTVDHELAGLQVAIAAPRETISKGAVRLDPKGHDLADLDMVVTYEVQTGRNAGTLGASELQLTDRTTRAAVHTLDPGMPLTNVPGTCAETGIVRFGPLPHDMPPINFPSIDCNTGKCEDVAAGWVRLHHNVWRATQMFAVLDEMHPATRSVFWERPGVDAQGNAVSIRTSPAYWFGSYDGDRYAAVREVIHDFWRIMRTNKTGSIELRLKCPNSWNEPGNACFTSTTLGHHWVKGYVNLCDRVWWGSPQGCSADLDNIDEVLHHEPLHHVFTHMNGLRALRDTITHGHGWGCLSGVTTKKVYCEESNGNAYGIRHFVEHGAGCWHHDKVVQAVDTYSQFIQTIGNMVQSGEMTHWPEPTPPTPTAPQCVGDIGCLCDDVGQHEDPDGDYLPSQYCEDNEGETVCMTRTFNASQTVGVCTLCDDHRGPGCECNDIWMPCEEGHCYGDDTGGTDSAIGTCYLDGEVPTFGCVADCEALLGNGGFCLPDHPDGARCVPTGTGLPEAHNCWVDEGHMDPQELECTDKPECILTEDCGSLGYPEYFVCDATLRCVAAL